MKILMLSWEYPPKKVGGLSNHVYNLSHALNDMGNEVHVITCGEENTALSENDNGVQIHRVAPYKIDTEDFVKWVMQLNFAMVEEGVRLAGKIGKFDIIHAHDWLVAFSAKALKWSFSIPMVCTIHSTEHGRNSGIRTDMQRYISSVEWMLNYESWKLVVCSRYMRQQLSDIFKAPWDKMWVIPNGVNCEEFDFEFDRLEYRRRFAPDDEKLIFYIGRHVFEKGIHLFVDSLPAILNRFPDTKVVIAGTGPMTEELKHKVAAMELTNKVVFTGYMGDEDRAKMYRVSDAAVFPSLYEPFGIVALEAMAAGCPVIASDTGGFSEIITHKVNGLKTINGSAESLSYNLMELLGDDKLASDIREKGYKTVKEQYSWNFAGELTMKMYEQVKEEAAGTEWGMKDETCLTTAKKTTRGRKTAEKKSVAQKETAADQEVSEKTEVKKTRRKKNVSKEDN